MKLKQIRHLFYENYILRLNVMFNNIQTDIISFYMLHLFLTFSVNFCDFLI